MQFLEEVPQTRLVRCATKHLCFVAELFDPRPHWDQIVAYKLVAAALTKRVQKLAGREKCPFSALHIYIDQRGLWLLVRAKKEMQLCHARMTLGALLEPFDDYEKTAELTSRKSVEQTVRPFDELDKVRLDSWRTVSALRPKFSRAPKRETPAAS